MDAIIIFLTDYLIPVSLLILGALLAAISALDALREGSNRASTLALLSALANAASGIMFFWQISS